MSGADGEGADEREVVEGLLICYAAWALSARQVSQARFLPGEGGRGLTGIDFSLKMTGPVAMLDVVKVSVADILLVPVVDVDVAIRFCADGGEVSGIVRRTVDAVMPTVFGENFVRVPRRHLLYSK